MFPYKIVSQNVFERMSRTLKKLEVNFDQSRLYLVKLRVVSYVVY